MNEVDLRSLQDMASMCQDVPKLRSGVPSYPDRCICSYATSFKGPVSMALTLTFWLLIHLFIHSFSSRWANHDHLSLKQSNKASNQIVFWCTHVRQQSGYDSWR